MTDDRFKLPPTATKAELIDRYNQLLEAYARKVSEAREASTRRAVPEVRADDVAADIAQVASVQGVLDGIGALRGQIGRTLNDLTEQMAAEAEQLEQLRRATAIETERLGELVAVGAAKDALTKLTAAWAERKMATESEYTARVADLERGYAEKARALENDIAQTRARWADETAERERGRKRDEAEYVYGRDRARKLDEDAYAEKKGAHERELREQKMRAAAELAAQAATEKTRAAEHEALTREAASFPEKLAEAVEQAREAAVAAVRREYDHQAALVATERTWERKVAEQQIAHANDGMRVLEGKNAELRAELALAQKQVQEIAGRAIDGASQARAFQSVNQIALEQARRADPKNKD